MDSKHVLLDGLRVSEMVTTMLLGDMDEADLLVRPTPGANHYAWQLGHLIGSMNQMCEMVEPGVLPALPEGFSESYTKETAANDDAAAFLSKQEYLNLLNAQRAGVRKLIDELDEARLDEPSPESMRELMPTLGDILHLVSIHEIMHSGQLSVVRRKQGKPVLF